MANIKVLDQQTVNQIAAGEVIERPASVVKELLENAIDAKSTAVTVEIRDGGISLVRVTDNGCGIPRDEIAMAFLRHATSKIQTVEDLFTVASLGFRGEALSSIASVAQVELITRTGDSMVGSRYQIEGGQEKSLEEVGAPEGTTFIARNLFYNTPARRKFLKTAMTEGAHVADIVEKIALSHPEISIRLIQNNQSKLHTSGNHNVKDIIYAVFGREIAGNLLPVTIGEPPVRIEGFIGKPLIARGNRNFENYFINGRYIRSSLIGKAIEDAYKPYMMQHKYPFTMLYFTIEPEFLDVNVHPAKMELRFRDGEMIYKMVYHTLNMALSQKELIPSVGLSAEEKDGERVKETGTMNGQKTLRPVMTQSRPEPFERRRLEQMQNAKDSYSRPLSAADSDLSFVGEEEGPYGGSAGSVQAQSTGTALPGERRAGGGLEKTPDAGKASQGPENKPAAREAGAHQKPGSADVLKMPAAGQDKGAAKARQLNLFEDKLLARDSRAEHILIGQLFDTYWLVQFHDNLYIIDQHAAHEKVLYERTMVSLKNREYTSQLINPPIILTLNSSEEVLLKQYLSHFTAIGFEIEPFGGKEYAVRAVPANLFSIAKKELLMDMIDSLNEGVEQHNPDVIEERIASMSCKAAVKGNHAMSQAEANQLIDELLELENPYACPHGRPTIISMSRYELEKKFKRIV